MQHSQQEQPPQQPPRIPATTDGDVLEYWRELDLDSKRLVLDQQCLEMREAKQQTLGMRKRLNEMTKEWRGQSPTDQRAAMLELLKAYQDEIDRLGKRAKYCEGAFLALYKSIYNAPDPVPFLERLTAAESTHSLQQLEMSKLRKEIEEYEEEFMRLKNQDITIRNLEDQIQDLKDNIDFKVNEEIEKKAAEIREQAQGEVSEALQHQQMLERRLAAAGEALLEAQRAADHAHTNVFEISRESEDKITALQSERQLLLEQSERLQFRCAELERETNQLRARLAESSSTIPSPVATGSTHTHNQVLESEIISLQRTVTELKQELLTNQVHTRDVQKSYEATIQRQNEQILTQAEQVSTLRSELASRVTPAELNAFKKQLHLLQQLAFSATSGGGTDIDEDGDDDMSANAGEHKSAVVGRQISETPEDTTNEIKLSVEQMMLSRIRKLESEAVAQRRQLQETSQALIKYQADIASLEQQLQAKTQLVLQLEEHVAAIDSSNSYEDPHTQDLSRLLGVHHRSSPRAAPKSHSQGFGATLNANPNSKDAVADGANANAMLTMLQSQRDRFKERAQLAEQQLHELQQQCGKLKSQSSQLEQDNLTLYQKIRYLQSFSYRTPNPNPRDSGLGLHGGEALGVLEEGRSTANVEGKYRAVYESRMSPFANFSQSEKQRKLSELSMAARIALNAVRALLSSATGRTVLVAYLLTLHGLVFFTLYYWSHAQTCHEA